MDAILNGIHYLDPNPTGEHAVILLHGLGADCESWPWQMEALAHAGYRPIALDLPGFGRSPRYRGRWTVARAAAVVGRFCESLGFEKFSLAGISMGGTVALQLALNHPQAVESLVLINTFARLKPRSVKQAAYFVKRFFLVSGGERSEQADYVAGRIFPHPDQEELRRELRKKVLEADPRVYREAMLSLALFGASRRLNELRLPVLVISGSEDTTIEPENQTALAKEIPGARQVVISGGGHGVTVDHPAEVNAAMLKFLSGTHAPRA